MTKRAFLARVEWGPTEKGKSPRRARAFFVFPLLQKPFWPSPVRVPLTVDYLFAAVTPSGSTKLPVNVAIGEPPAGYLKTSPSLFPASAQ
jgi:hypothetical protein